MLYVHPKFHVLSPEDKSTWFQFCFISNNNAATPGTYLFPVPLITTVSLCLSQLKPSSTQFPPCSWLVSSSRSTHSISCHNYWIYQTTYQLPVNQTYYCSIYIHHNTQQKVSSRAISLSNWNNTVSKNSIHNTKLAERFYKAVGVTSFFISLLYSYNHPNNLQR